MNFKGYRLVILAVISVAMASFVYSSPKRKLTNSSSVKKLTEFKKRRIKLSFHSRYSEDPLYIRIYSPNPEYKKRSKKQNKQPLLIREYPFKPDEGTEMFSYVEVQKGPINPQGGLGYISKIEFEDSRGIHVVDNETIQLINKIIEESDFKNNLDIVFVRNQIGEYKFVAKSKRVGFFVDKEIMEYEPSVTIFGYNPALNAVESKELRFKRPEHFHAHPSESTNVFDDNFEGPHYITRIEVREPDGRFYLIKDATINAINNKIDKAFKDEVVYFQLLRKSGNNGYSLIHNDYQPERQNSFIGTF